MSARRIESLDDAAAYLESLFNIERRPDAPYARLGLGPIRRLLERLGHPERGHSIVHIGGSKGKGSTALLVEAVLAAAGESVGTFTSPHLERWTERFRVGGREVPDAQVAAAVARIQPHVEALRAQGPEEAPTFFDATTAAALLLFRDAGVDRVVLEVGLGGRLDSTNAVDPAVTCVTSIELEHTEKLGNTLAAIAGEKAGILKRSCPAVVGRLVPEAASVLEDRAAEVGAPIARLGKDFHVEVLHQDAEGLRLALRDGDVALEATLPVLGVHQADNAALAMACVIRLGAHSSAKLAEAVLSGFSRVRLPGRIEVLGRAPWLIVDAAHTADSGRTLAHALAQLPHRKMRLVLSVSAGKNLGALLEALLPLADEVFVTRADSARSLSAEDVARAVRARMPGLGLHAVPNPHLAVRTAREGLATNDLLCVTGSVYLAGIARRALRSGGGESAPEDQDRPRV